MTLQFHDPTLPLAIAADNGVALTLREGLTLDEWLDVGKNLGRASQGIQWFVGDWLNYGVVHGYVAQDKYDLAEEVTHMAKGWLYQCAWVARSIDPADRKADLSFEHHRRIASLKPGLERSVLLQAAVDMRMSVRDLRDVATSVMSPADLEADGFQELDRDTLEPAAAPLLTLGIPIDSPVQGKVITLGNHRLIVGDASDPLIMDALFEGESEASVVWTDPPYGVDYTGKTEDALTIQNDAKSADDLVTVLSLAFVNIDRHLRTGSGIYIASGFAHMDLFVGIVDAVGWRFSTELVWVKNRWALGWGHYHPQHEAIIYAMKGNGMVRFYGGRDRSTVFGLETVDGEVSFSIPSPSANREHPTMKPPKLIFEMIRNSAMPGEIVLDPFAGSGSTMIAAEQLGQRAFMIELDPVYANVIIERYKREIENV